MSAQTAEAFLALERQLAVRSGVDKIKRLSCRRLVRPWALLRTRRYRTPYRRNFPQGGSLPPLDSLRAVPPSVCAGLRLNIPRSGERQPFSEHGQGQTTILVVCGNRTPSPHIYRP